MAHTDQVTHADLWIGLAKSVADDLPKMTSAFEMIGLDGNTDHFKSASVGTVPIDLDVDPQATRLSIISRGLSKVYVAIPTMHGPQGHVLLPVNDLGGSFFATLSPTPIGQVRVWADAPTEIEFASK